MGTEYTKFLNECAASEDRISRLWSEILKENKAIEVRFIYLSFSSSLAIDFLFAESFSEKVQ